jgi:hypothetical protein
MKRILREPHKWRAPAACGSRAALCSSLSYITNHWPPANLHSYNHYSLAAELPLIYVNRSLFPQTVYCAWTYVSKKCRKTLGLNYVALVSHLRISSKTRTRAGTDNYPSQITSFRCEDRQPSFIPLSLWSKGKVQWHLRTKDHETLFAGLMRGSNAPIFLSVISS